MNKVYLDYTATTPVDSEVLNAMLPWFAEEYGNPSSVYSLSRAPRRAIQQARETVAEAIGALPDEIFFTGSGTEADNWAIKGVLDRSRGKHFITTSIEHHAVLHTAEYVKKMGRGDVTFLSVDGEGRIDPDELRGAIRDDTALVSVMFANNEVGTIEPVEQIAKICHEKNVLFHTDAVQAAPQLNINVKELGIDLMSMSAHKMYGPKGVGALYVRKGVRLENLLQGGAQERGRRASTENVAGIVGFAKAFELMKDRMPEYVRHVTALRDKLIDGMLAKVPHTKLNGPRGEGRLPNNTNFSFIGVEGETLLLDLDAKGIYASTGSACSSESLDPSHVLLALGLSHEMAHGSVRMTLGRFTTDEQIDYVLEVLPEIVKRRREMSPLWDDYIHSR